MKTRTCPHCNYKYSITEYWKQVLFKLVFSEWNCKNCSKKLTFNFTRRVFVALAFGSLYIALFSLKNVFVMTLEMGCFINHLYHLLLLYFHF